MSAADTAVIVFARAPRPGAAKTRLIARLGPEGAAGLHARLVKHALETAKSAAFPIELRCDPGTDDDFFRFCGARYGASLSGQGPGDLGARMRAAFEEALREHATVLLIGSDCPAMAAGHLRRAARALREGHDAVFVPCEDGGYALIGLKRVAPELFEGIAWGGTEVMAVTRARLAVLGWRWLELETLWDVDRPEDYQRLLDSGLLDRRTAA
jgi:rSAM/selenodomain-associated transferase 1